MARLWSTGFECNSLSKEFDLVQGSNASTSTSFINGGSYSMKVADSASSSYIQHRVLSSPTTVAWFTKIDFFITAYPSGGDYGIMAFDGFGVNLRLQLVISTDGTIHVDKFGTGYIGNAGSAISINSWHTMEMHVDTTPGAGACIVEAKIDGAYFTQINNETIGSINSFDIGNYKSSTGTAYFDNFAVNDNSGSVQNSWIGLEKIIHLLPNGAGDNNAFTVQVGGVAGSTNNFTRVNEVPPDDATSYNADTVSGDIDDFAITDPVLGHLPVINFVSVNVRYAGLSAVSDATFNVRCKKASSGTVSIGTSITPSSTSWTTNANSNPFVPTLTLYTDPDGNMWTPQTLATAQIGYQINSVGVNAAAISNIWMQVGYTNSTVLNQHHYLVQGFQ